MKTPTTETNGLGLTYREWLDRADAHADALRIPVAVEDLQAALAEEAWVENIDPRRFAEAVLADCGFDLAGAAE